MILNLLLASVLILIGIITGIVLTMLLDYMVDQLLRRTVFKPDDESIQARAVATLLRWSLPILAIPSLLKFIVSTPSLALRQVMFGAVIGVAFAFIFLVGSYTKVKLVSNSDSADQST